MDNITKIDYDLSVLDRPGLTLPPAELSALQAKLSQLGRLCFDPLPDYQVFSTPTSTAFNDKIIILATSRTTGALLAFMSTVVLPIPGPATGSNDTLVLHTGLTVIHPSRRQSGVLYSLFGALFLHLAPLHPRGFWLTSLSRILTSLGHLATYTTRVYPSPAWDAAHGGPGRPSGDHLRIAREISARHRAKMLIPPEARFDEERFVFRAERYGLAGPGAVGGVGVGDQRHEHRDRGLSGYYRGLLEGRGDEVLQVAWFDPGYTFKKGARLLARL